LRYRTWEDDGQKRSAVEVVAYRVEFLSAPAAGSGGEVVPFEAAVA
jgi:single-stranded DNA-binding protein